MKMYYNTVTDTAGNIVNGATVTVYEDGGAVATIYDYLGSPISNPFQSGLNRSEGEIEFAAASGIYDIKIVNGLETDWIRNEVLFDPSEPGEIGATAPAKLTCTEFTSNGIDDNATGERVQIADSLLSIGAAGASYPVAHASADQNIELVGGSASGNGGAVKVYGGSHATKAGDIELLSGDNMCVKWDEDNGEFVIYTGTGSKSEAARFYAGGSAKIANTLTLGGGAILAADAVSYTATYGGNVSDNGGGIVLYGGSHATLPGDVYLQSGANPFLSWDESAGTLDIASGTGVKTSAIAINASQVAAFSQIPNVGGNDVLTSDDIDVTVQGYDSDTAKTDVANTFTQAQTVSYAQPGSLAHFTITDSGNGNKVFFVLNPGIGSYSPITRADDALISAWTGAVDTTPIVLAPAATHSVGIRIDPTDDSLALRGTTVTINGSDAASATNTLTLTNKTLTSPVINTGVSGTAILDEDNMASNSATKLATQQSIKAYVDSVASGSATYRGATVYSVGGQNVSSSTNTVFTDLDTEITDTDSIHDTATNPERMTVPSGVTKIRLMANVGFGSNSSGYRRAAFIKNSSTSMYWYQGLTISPAVNGDQTSFVVESLTLNVTGGDYFRLYVYQNSGSVINVIAAVEMEIVE